MLLRNNRTNKKPKVNYEDYLGSFKEPKEKYNYDITPELEDELVANRFFLKKRVWKNMNKIKRSKTTYDKQPRESKSSVYRPRHLSA